MFACILSDALYMYLYTYIHRVGPLVTIKLVYADGGQKFLAISREFPAQIGNFKNVAYSVARRHQRLLCGYLQGRFFTYDMYWNVALVGRCNQKHLIHVFLA